MLGHLKDTFHGKMIQLHFVRLYFWNSCGPPPRKCSSRQQRPTRVRVFSGMFTEFLDIWVECVQISGQQGSHILYKEHCVGPGFLALSEVSPGRTTTSFPALPPRVLSYLFHLAPQPVNATPLGFGDPSVSHFMDGDGRAGCGGMDRSHWRGNTYMALRNY